MKPLARLLLVLAFGATLSANPPAPDFHLNVLAQEYVKLVLATGQFDSDYVDAFYGPPDMKHVAQTTKRRLPELQAMCNALASRLKAENPDKFQTLTKLRYRYLVRQLRSLQNKLALLSGKTCSFDEESQLLYDTVLPSFPAEKASALRAKLASLVPGEGPLMARLEEFEKRFVVPREFIADVLQASINECRRRTRQHIALPENESLYINLVTQKPWAAYNWYKGNAQSLVEVNIDLPFQIEEAITLVAHEGYPGHHVHNVLLEQELARKRGWIEFTICPLFSPRSIIDEGSADYGVDLVFPQEERARFAAETLFPLANLNASQASLYFQVRKLREELEPLGDDICRLYVDGKLTHDAALQRLMTEVLLTEERAAKSLEFARHYRSYLITYHVGKPLVKHYVETQEATSDSDPLWGSYAELISSPKLPSDLR